MSDQPIADPAFLAMLACPESGQPLSIAEDELLQAVNARITGGECQNVGGEKVSEVLEAGLVREDKKIVYPVRDQIPVLLVDEGITL